MLREVESNLYFINVFILLCCTNVSTLEINTPQKCPPLSLQNGEVICTRDPGSTMIRTCEEEQGIGTIASYKCNPHFVFYEKSAAHFNNYTIRHTPSSPLTLDTKDQVLKCGQNGKWIGIGKFKTYGCREDCGTRLTNAKPLIVNGVPTNTSSWPWHATLFKKIGAGNSLHYICGGTIIKKSAILTAAHCVSVSPAVKLDPNSFVVVLGTKSHIFDENTNIAEIQIFGVAKIFVSESYDAKKEFQADIAILQLNGTIKYSDAVLPVCLPNDFVADLNAIKPGRSGDVVGFGIDENKKLSKSLKHAKLEIKSHSECYVQLERTLSESQFCAGSLRDEKWVTVCNGDSGGSLVQPSLTHEKYFIRGIVSTGDSKVRVGVCQNEAVFTRVFSFIGWIQNVLEEIGGNLALEFDSSFGVPYVLKGEEIVRTEFIPIPIEWKNLVNSIELTNVDVEPEILLDSLEYSKTIQHINFIRVNFKKSFSRRRVRLPHLKSISLDILREDLDIFKNRTLPLALGNNYLASIIFFDKEIEDDYGFLDLNRIASLKVDMKITVHIFKLLEIWQESGKICISQVAPVLANAILLNRLTSDFGLKHLALSRCSINSTALQLISQQSEIQILILDSVEMEDQNVILAIASMLKSLDQLQELVFVGGKFENISINAQEISNGGLNHLAISGAILAFEELDLTHHSSRPSDPTTILFPDSNQNALANNRNNRLLQISKLRSLYCNSCLPSTKSIQNCLQKMQLIFPGLKELVLVSTEPMHPTILLNLLSRFKELEFAFLKLKGVFSKFSKQNGRLVQEVNNGFEYLELEHLDFVMNRRENFWSSEGDFVALTRLTSAETIGYNTGHYSFNSGIIPQPNGHFEDRPEVQFRVIPSRIQNRLESMEISNVLFKIRDIADTTKFCSRLKRIVFVNISQPSSKERDGHPEYSELPSLEEYYLSTPFIDAWSILGYHGLKLVSETLFQYVFPWRGEASGFDIKKNFLESKVKKIHNQHGDCVGISWIAKEGYLVSALNHTHAWFESVNKNPGIVIKYFAFKYWELDPTVVPPSIEDINLNFVVLKNYNIPKLFERLTTLKSIRFVNVRASDNNPADFKTWVWPDINSTHLALRHSTTLEFMAFEKVRFKHYTSGVIFDQLKTAYFESCEFSVEFLKNFVTIFPKLTRLAIVGGSRVDGYILLHAAKLQNMEWILSTRAGVGSDALREKLKKLLGGQNLKVEEESVYFIIEKINGVWTHVDISDDQIKSQMEEMKGVKVFGTDLSCHALSFIGGIKKETHINLPQVHVN